MKEQILLGRRSISPGVVDGRDGENFRKAIAQFRRQENLGEGDTIDEATWAMLGGDTIKDLVVPYEVTMADARYRFVRRIPHDWLAKQLDDGSSGLAHRRSERRRACRPGFPFQEPCEGGCWPGKIDGQGAAMLVADARTEADFNAGTPPSYPIVLKAPNGMYVPPQDSLGRQMRFRGDIGLVMDVRRERALQTFARMEEARASQERFEAGAQRQAAARRARREQRR